MKTSAQDSAKVLGCAKFQSVVRSMEVVCFSEVAFTLSLCKLQSIPQGFSTVERQSASWRVRYGKLHCTLLTSLESVNTVTVVLYPPIGGY